VGAYAPTVTLPGVPASVRNRLAASDGALFGVSETTFGAIGVPYES
jgi:hypothetical protein